MKRKSAHIELRSPIVLALALAFALPSAAAIAAETPTILRIGFVRGYGSARSAGFTATSAFQIVRTGTAERLAAGTAASPIALDAAQSQIVLRCASGTSGGVGSSVTVIADEPNALITVNVAGRSRQYRGSVEVNVKSGVLQLVNVVELEDYLLGVVPAEMSHLQPEEALKAQAIAARTYALRNLNKHASSGFDLCDDTNCQVYAGVSAERPRATKAVNDTRGVVLTYGGEIAHVMYSADCGGMTENRTESWPECSAPYLCGVVEPEGIKHRSWQRSFTVPQLAEILRRGGIREASGLKTIAVSRTSSSGRALEVQLTGASGAKKISGERFRLILGLDSRLYSIQQGPDGNISVTGRGWGHGVGMCQVGASALAGPQFGCTCEQILAHYFPGTTLSSALPTTTAVAAAPGARTARPGVVRLPLPQPAQSKAPAQQSKRTSSSDSEGGIRMKLRLEEPKL